MVDSIAKTGATGGPMLSGLRCQRKTGGMFGKRSHQFQPNPRLQAEKDREGPLKSKTLGLAGQGR